jgi:hypothetical protein
MSELFSEVIDELINTGLLLHAERDNEFFMNTEFGSSKWATWHMQLEYKGVVIKLPDYEQGAGFTNVELADFLALERTVIETLYDINHNTTNDYLAFLQYTESDFGHTDGATRENFHKRLFAKRQMRKLLGETLYDRFMNSEMDI